MFNCKHIVSDIFCVLRIWCLYLLKLCKITLKLTNNRKVYLQYFFSTKKKKKTNQILFDSAKIVFYKMSPSVIYLCQFVDLSN